MRSLSSYSCGAKYLLCVIDVFTKYVWIKSLKDKKAKTVLNDFIEIINESVNQINCWLIKGAESVVAKRFIKTLKSKSL